MEINMESLPFVYPDLAIEVTTSKGRLVSAAGSIRRGEVVMVDRPYALVPAMILDDPPFLLCSRHQCNRRIPSKVTSQTTKVGCPDHCIAEVVWCSEECMSQDTMRHDMECLWLRQTSAEIREKHGDGAFGLLWMIARILIVKHLNERASDQTNGRSSKDHQTEPSDGKVSSSHFGRRGWDAVWNLEGEPESFPAEKVAEWRAMTEKYLVKDTLRFKYLVDDIVKLICKAETNSFGLYPGITGEFPEVSPAGRGDYYGAGIYPTAAMFNHACCPNITHEVDGLGRRIFKAGRDIEPGEECCICYFDLAEFTSATARQEAIKTSWDFDCSCERCEEDADIPSYLKEINMD